MHKTHRCFNHLLLHRISTLKSTNKESMLSLLQQNQLTSWAVASSRMYRHICLFNTITSDRCEQLNTLQQWAETNKNVLFLVQHWWYNSRRAMVSLPAGDVTTHSGSLWSPSKLVNLLSFHAGLQTGLSPNPLSPSPQLPHNPWRHAELLMGRLFTLFSCCTTHAIPVFSNSL